jgi:multimeric flavodoxin WrbA
VDVLILDGSPAPGGGFGAWLDGLEPALRGRGVGARRIVLRERRIAQCRGCFECWVKTPGRCTTRDDAEEILRAALASDLVVHASPVVMGFVSALLKRAGERFLPVLHPYFRLEGGEFRHRLRYPRYPRLALVHGHEGCDEEDARLLADVYRELARETRTTLAVVASTAAMPEEVADALARA